MIACLVASGIVIWLNPRPTGALDPETLGYYIGTAIGLLVFPTIVSWITWRFSGRSKVASTLSFFVVLAMLVILQASQKSVADRTAINEVAKEYSDGIEHQKQKYLALAAKADMEHVLNFAWLTDKSQVPARRTAVQLAMAANLEWRRHLAAGAEEFRQALVQRGVSERKVTATVADFVKAQDGKLPVVLRIRDEDADLYKSTITLLNLLESQWGHWSRSSGRMVFEDDDTLTTFNATMRAVQATAQAQMADQKQLGVKPQ